MIVHRSGVNGLTLYIDAEEMACCGFDELGEDAARALAEVAISDLGLTASLNEIEAFAGAGGALIFASLRARPRAVMFEFSCLDYLLDAAKSALYLEPGGSSLYLLDGKYILVGFNASDAFALHMSEYARRMPDLDGYELFLREHGKLLEPENALVRLAGTR